MDHKTKTSLDIAYEETSEFHDASFLSRESVHSDKFNSSSDAHESSESSASSQACASSESSASSQMSAPGEPSVSTQTNTSDAADGASKERDACEKNIEPSPRMVFSPKITSEKGDEAKDWMKDPRELDNKSLGFLGEQVALEYLKLSDYLILETRWTCAYGEADIIAQSSEGNIVFVEVKTRCGVEKGLPEEAVTKKKRAKYENIAMCYLQNHDIETSKVSFDVVGIVLLGNNRAFLRHIKNAFSHGE